MELVGGPPYEIAPETEISPLLPKDWIETPPAAALNWRVDLASA